MTYSLKILAANRVVKKLNEELIEEKVPLAYHRQEFTRRIQSNVLPDLVPFLEACSSSHYLSKAIEISEEKSFFIEEFSDFFETMKKVMSNFHEIYGNEASRKQDSLEKTFHGRYLNIKNLMLNQINLDRDLFKEDPKSFSINYGNYFEWAIENGFEDLACEIFDKTPNDVMEKMLFHKTPFVNILNIAVRNKMENLVMKTFEKIPEEQRFVFLTEGGYWTVVHRALHRGLSRLTMEILLNIPEEKKRFDLLKNFGESGLSTLFDLAAMNLDETKDAKNLVIEILSMVSEEHRFELLKMKVGLDKTIIDKAIRLGLKNLVVKMLSMVSEKHKFELLNDPKEYNGETPLHEAINKDFKNLAIKMLSMVSEGHRFELLKKENIVNRTAVGLALYESEDLALDMLSRVSQEHRFELMRMNRGRLLLHNFCFNSSLMQALESVSEEQRFELLKIGDESPTLLYDAIILGFEDLVMPMLLSISENKRFDLLMLQCNKTRIQKVLESLKIRKTQTSSLELLIRIKTDLFLKILDIIPKNKTLELLKIQHNYLTIFDLAILHKREDLVIKMLNNIEKSQIDDFNDFFNIRSKIYIARDHEMFELAAKLDEMKKHVKEKKMPVITRTNTIPKIAIKSFPYIILALGVTIAAFNRYFSNKDDQ